MATNPSGPSRLYTISKWQYLRPAAKIFFAILGVIMQDSPVVRWPEALFSKLVTVEHTYDACPKYSELGSFRIIAYPYVSEGSRR